MKDARLATAKANQLAAKKKEKDAKLAKQQLKLQRQEAEMIQEQLRRTFAGSYAKSIAQFLSEKDHGAERRDVIRKHMKALGKRPWTKVKQPPEFWNAGDRGGLRCISGKDHFGNFLDPEPAYASESSSWEIWFHEFPTKPTALPQMRRYMERTFPGYAQLCGARFPMEDLLRDCFDNADVVFLMTAWLHSSLM